MISHLPTIYFSILFPALGKNTMESFLTVPCRTQHLQRLKKFSHSNPTQIFDRLLMNLDGGPSTFQLQVSPWDLKRAQVEEDGVKLWKSAGTCASAAKHDAE